MASLLLRAARVAGVSLGSAVPLASTSNVPGSLLRTANLTGLRAFSASTKPLFDKILIANRGEIACRVMKSARDLGIETVAVFSDADATAKHVKMADEAINIGAPPSAESYLREDRILDAVMRTGAQAVHPGYGFLAENAGFAKKLEDAGIAWIGPPASAIEVMGDKIISKQIAKDAGVSTIPGFDGEIENADRAVEVAREIGYPIMIKATAGGGGKGMRIAWDDDECREGFMLSKSEAKSSFGDDRMLVEKFIDQPRHIEIQVISDGHGHHVYLPERECTIQRRNQKVIEEAPSTYITPEIRTLMGEQAAALAKHVGYRSAGTVEMLVDGQHNHYFLEMNTRLQVEHPVTEYITGIDLVEQMLRVAAGLPLTVKQEDVSITGWAMESRVYAEDPLRDFLPSVGRLNTYREPTGHPTTLESTRIGLKDKLYQSSVSADNTVRVDSGVLDGSDILMYYDPLISKLITYGHDRPSAIDSMKRALDSYVIRGVNHNIPFLRDVMENDKFLKGDLTTNFIAEEYPDGFKGHDLASDEQHRLAAAAAMIHKRLGIRRRHTSQRLSSAGLMLHATTHPIESLRVTIGDEVLDVSMRTECTAPHDGEMCVSDDFHVSGVTVKHEDPKKNDVSTMVVSATQPLHPDGVFETTITDLGTNEEVDMTLQILEGGETESFDYVLQYCGSKYDVQVAPPHVHEFQAHMPEIPKLDMSKLLVSPMAGALLDVAVKEGDKVVLGQNLAMVEAMKMQNILRSELDGVVKKVLVVAGDSVSADQILMEFE